MADNEQGDGRTSPGEFSRRALLRRAGKGAVVAGLAVWAVPEIVVASPSGAQPLSAPPTSGGGGFPAGSGSGSTPVPGTSGTGDSVSSADGSSTAVPATAGSNPDGGALAFTGTDAEALLGAGAALVAGGWVINRWASRRESSPEPEPPAG